MQKRLRAEAGKDGAFEIRIGPNTGSCLVGNVGSINRINVTAIGDTVNVAARPEAANKELGTAILASDSTVQAAGPGFVCRDLGPIHVKGWRKWWSCMRWSGCGCCPPVADIPLLHSMQGR